jgi:aldose 1-epimerase
VVLAAPAGGGSVTVWMDEAWGYIQVFTGDTLSADERRRSIAVEPQTCPANAFNSGEGLRVLEPGESFSGSWGISPGL